MPKCKDCDHFLQVLLSIGDCDRWEIHVLSTSPSCEAFKPKKASLGQGVLCVVGILSLQAFMTWLDNAPINDLLVALVMLLGLLGAWMCHRIWRVWRIMRRE